MFFSIPHILFYFFLAVSFSVSARTIAATQTIEAIRVIKPISVDGKLTEDVWQRPGREGFRQLTPNDGDAVSQRTEVWVAYDDDALYIGVHLYDSAPDSITQLFGRRDAPLVSDFFYVGIDAYHDRRTGFYFTMYASGSLGDGTLYNDEQNDNSWDGVWEGASQITTDGWTCEMRIPYSQLRFEKQGDYVWGINFLRYISRRNELSLFAYRRLSESGFVSRFADLTGIHSITPPARLEIRPYAVAKGTYLKPVTNDPFHTGSSYRANAGADIKAGISSNLTFDATLNPDFGQVEVDPAVVNLSAYETFYQEKRPFFVEGSSMYEFGRGGSNLSSTFNLSNFNWSNPNFFYSRRIGRAPQGRPVHSGFIDMPEGASIIGAGKLTGKISEGWSLGFLNAVTARTHAQVDSAGVRFEDEIEPLTYYGVLRSTHEFNNGAQSIGIISTATVRDVRDPNLSSILNKNALTLGADGWTFLDTSRMWVLTGWMGASTVTGTEERMIRLQRSPQHYYQRPDQSHVTLDSSRTSLSGWATRWVLNKQQGNLRANIALGLISPGFESNDIGFVGKTDVISAHAFVYYNWFDPDPLFRSKILGAALTRSYDFGGNKTNDGVFVMTQDVFLNYWSVTANFFYRTEVLSNDATRGGPLMSVPAGWNANVFVLTDVRKKIAFDAYIIGARSAGPTWQSTVGADAIWQPAPSIKFSIGPTFGREFNNAQYVDQTPDVAATKTFGRHYIFGELIQTIFTANIRLDWAFTPKLSLQLFAQPLFATGAYTNIKELASPRSYSFTPYNATRSYDFNTKSFRANAVLRWECLPGSTLYFVLTQQRAHFGNPADFDLARDARTLFDAHPDNIFLIKFSYWLHP